MIGFIHVLDAVLAKTRVGKDVVCVTITPAVVLARVALFFGSAQDFKMDSHAPVFTLPWAEAFCNDGTFMEALAMGATFVVFCKKNGVIGC